MNEPRKLPSIEHIDVPQVSETFVDSVDRIMFDGQSLRVDFGVTRIQEAESADAPLSGKRYTACRIVLPPAAALQLSSKLSQMMVAIVNRAAVTKQKVQGEEIKEQLQSH
jgi:hypothetical protein